MRVSNLPVFVHKASSSCLRQFLVCLLLFGTATHGLAELEELDDDNLEQLRGKEGITIDVSYKLSIGQIAWKFSDQELDEERRKNNLAPPPPRIEYHVNDN